MEPILQGNYDDTALAVRLGDRVQLHPATDLWMRGAKYGTVVKFGRKYLHIQLDINDKIVKMLPTNVCIIGRAK
jgi:hypothetical protein